MPRSWGEIKEFYEELVNAGLPVQGMVRLVDQIRTSQYAGGLFAWTSMHILCVAKKPATIQDPGPCLKISPTYDGNIDFRFVDTAIESRQWHRVVLEDEAFARLERFWINCTGSAVSGRSSRRPEVQLLCPGNVRFGSWLPVTGEKMASGEVPQVTGSSRRSTLRAWPVTFRCGATCGDAPNPWSLLNGVDPRRRASVEPRLNLIRQFIGSRTVGEDSSEILRIRVGTPASANNLAFANLIHIYRHPYARPEADRPYITCGDGACSD